MRRCRALDHPRQDGCTLVGRERLAVLVLIFPYTEEVGNASLRFAGLVCLLRHSTRLVMPMLHQLATMATNRALLMEPDVAATAYFAGQQFDARLIAWSAWK